MFPGRETKEEIEWDLYKNKLERMLEMVWQRWDIYIRLTRNSSLDSLFYNVFKISIFIFYILVEQNFLAIDGLIVYV